MSFFARLPRLRKTFPDGTSHRTYLGLGVLTANIFLFGHAFTTYFYETSFPYGASMVPTIYAADESLIISKLHTRGKNVQVGDVVCFKHPIRHLNRMGAIKRIIGMPGDFVLLNSPDAPSDAMIQVPEGHCFVAGDNQKLSRDSRMYGPIPLALITGKVIYRWWPISRAGVIPNGMQEPDYGHR